MLATSDRRRDRRRRRDGSYIVVVTYPICHMWSPFEWHLLGKTKNQHIDRRDMFCLHWEGFGTVKDFPTKVQTNLCRERVESFQSDSSILPENIVRAGWDSSTRQQVQKRTLSTTRSCFLHTGCNMKTLRQLFHPKEIDIHVHEP